MNEQGCWSIPVEDDVEVCNASFYLKFEGGDSFRSSGNFNNVHVQFCAVLSTQSLVVVEWCDDINSVALCISLNMNFGQFLFLLENYSCLSAVI